VANLTTIPDDVLATISVTDKKNNYGETVVTGDVVYLSNVDNLWRNAGAALTILESGQFGVGIALNGGAINQPAVIAIEGSTIDLGDTVVQAELYVISKDLGKISPRVNLVVTNFVTLLGFGNDNNEIVLDIVFTGLALP